MMMKTVEEGIFSVQHSEVQVLLVLASSSADLLAPSGLARHFILCKPNFMYTVM